MVKTLSRPVEQEPDLAQLDACRQIIGQHCYSTQEEIRRELSERGFADISQSTISRLLRRLGVAKAQNANGKKVYTLVDEQLEPPAVPAPSTTWCAKWCTTSRWC